ncbi:MAG: prolyl oligopeptidase family serine peptidase, partial [Armatimonadota bacterium]
MRILSLSICAALAIVPLKHAAAQAADENRKPGPTKEDLRAELARLREALASARRQGDAANERVYLINYPLARLKARKADLLINTNVFWGPVEQVASRELRRGLQALSRLAKGETVDLTKPGILELAYECDVDGTAQPFYVLLPENYDPDRPTPLVVFLHGYVPEINIVDPWVPSETETGAARSLGFIFMVPYGRRNTDFVAVGEVDVLDAIEATKRIFNVASDRIYMMGVSMGGYGTWNIGLRYPHEFAALGPVSGQTDMAAWLRRPFDDMPWWKAWHYRWDNPIELADNAVAIPSHLMWGQDDRLIPVQHGRNMVARLRRLGADVTYVEVPNEDHYIYWGPRVYDATMKWFVGKKRDLWPRHVRYRTWSLRYDTAYWVTIEQFKQWGRDALIDVRVEGDQRINVQAKNVAAYTLRLSDRLLDPKRKVLVVTNDETSFEGLPPADGRLTVCLDAAYRDHKDEGLWKRKGLCGPIEDAYNYPFLIVRGTGDARAAADRFADEWDKYADGKPR